MRKLYLCVISVICVIFVLLFIVLLRILDFSMISVLIAADQLFAAYLL